MNLFELRSDIWKADSFSFQYNDLRNLTQLYAYCRFIFQFTMQYAPVGYF